MDIRSLFRNDRRRKKLRDGTIVHIKPLNVKQTSIIEGLFDPLADGWVEHGFDSLDVQVQHTDALIGIVAISIGKDRTFVENLDKRDYDELWALLLEIERDFLQGRVLLAAKKMSGRLSSEMTTGGTPSSS
jgi:hypothetical protein